MTDGGDQLALAVHFLHEMIGAGVPANVVWRVAAGHYNAVELGGGDFVVGFVAVDRISVFAQVCFTCLGSHGHHLGARFPEAVQGIPYLLFLITVVDEENTSFSGELHSFSMLP